LPGRREACALNTWRKRYPAKLRLEGKRPVLIEDAQILPKREEHALDTVERRYAGPS
jgi:hypothetical protein